MKIGIFTFHWSTNYGAILQAYCLQEYLLEQGHEVEIVNYKPRKYDFSWLTFVRHPRMIKRLNRTLANRRKEQLLVTFRNQHLRLTKRYSSVNEFDADLDKYDVLISGSDQVLNPNITMQGEDDKPCSAYWLAFVRGTQKRIGYAVSFGFESYPENAVDMVKEWVNGFNAIGVREHSGINILKQLQYNGISTITPDPTILMGADLFRRLKVEVPVIKEDYSCVYMLRHEINIEGNIRYIDELHQPLSLEDWLNRIVKAQNLITNSYHGMIMAMLAHVPFVVLLEKGSESGMNDRFFTLSSELGIENRFAHTLEEAQLILKEPMDFDRIDERIDRFRQLGITFINQNIIML